MVKVSDKILINLFSTGKNKTEEIGQNILVITIFLTTRYIHMLLIHYKIKGTVILPRVAIHAIPPLKFYNTVFRVA
jgi:hypothetical protein